MKTVLTALLLAALTLVGVSGCKSNSTASSQPIKVNASVSAQASADAAKVQTKVQACLTKTGVITKTARQAFYACVGVSKGNEAVVEKCATAKLSADGALTKAARAKFYNDLAGCVVA